MTDRKRGAKVLSMADRLARSPKPKTSRYILCPDGSLIDFEGMMAELIRCIYIDLDPKDVTYDVDD